MAFFAVAITAAWFTYASVHEARADSGDNLSGYAWSETIGWINVNGATYGVSVQADGVLEGYAWAETIGWISFNESELAGCPAAPCRAVFDGVGAVTGWARALAGAGASGWDGWISLSGTSPDYGVTVSDCDWSGYAWGSDIVGWIHFRANDGTSYGVAGAPGTFACVGGTTEEPSPPPPLPPPSSEEGGTGDGGEGQGQQGQQGGVEICDNGTDDDGDTLVDGDDPDCAPPPPGTISVNLGAIPNPSTAGGGGTSDVTLTAQVLGTEPGTINYSFWWDCSNPTTNVADAGTACGALPAPSPGNCVSNAAGAKCDAISATNQSVLHAYAVGSLTAKVIAERGAAVPAEDRISITVNPPPSFYQANCVDSVDEDPNWSCDTSVVVITAEEAESSSVGIAIVAGNGYSGTINLSASSETLPIGTQYVFSINPIQCANDVCNSAVSQFHIITTPAAAIGGHDIAVRLSDGVSSPQIVIVRLNVRAIRPEFREF